jgi:hypothetical protein
MWQQGAGCKLHDGCRLIRRAATQLVPCTCNSMVTRFHVLGWLCGVACLQLVSGELLSSPGNGGSRWWVQAACVAANTSEPQCSSQPAAATRWSLEFMYSGDCGVASVQLVSGSCCHLLAMMAAGDGCELQGWLLSSLTLCNAARTQQLQLLALLCAMLCTV